VLATPSANTRYNESLDHGAEFVLRSLTAESVSMKYRWPWLVAILALSTATGCGGGAFVLATESEGGTAATNALVDSTAVEPLEAGGEDAAVDTPVNAPGDAARPDDATAEDNSQTDAEGDTSVPQDATSDTVDKDAFAMDADDGGHCASRTVNVNTGVFVAPGGSTASNCGSQQSPCSTVQAGLDRAYAAGRPTVYVSHGVYVESIALRPGITLEGGWEVIGSTWIPNCVDPSGAVIIQAPPTATVSAVADNLGGLATIATLTLQSKDQIDVHPGESLYGLRATGATTQLTLKDVGVQTANAGDGSPGVGGGPGAIGGPCGVEGDGGSGGPGAQGNGAEGGVFSGSGYSPSVGSAGSIGTTGENGSETTPPTCASCGSCTALNCGFSPNGSQSCGSLGSPGCGGPGGTPGGGGSGGGSAVALYVWDATVHVMAGSLTAGNGGTGGNGGLGGNGGAGGQGSTGSAGPGCTARCSGLAVCTSIAGAGAGGVGGVGGRGGPGGAGGGGAGGSSFAIVRGGTAAIDVNGARLAHGSVASGGGPDGGVGAPGMAADQWP
jgi:hypothetical protein